MWWKPFGVVWIGAVILIWTLGQPYPLTAGEQSLIEVEVKGVAADPRGGMSPVVLLEEKTPPNRVLPIWVGLFEARAIAMEMEAVVTPRPMTHDLIKNILEGVKANVKSVVVAELRDNTFYATIILQLADTQETRIDSRPSDAIALALRVHAPIYVDKDVMATAPHLEEPAKEIKEISIIDPYGFSVQPLTPTLAELFHLTKPEGLLIADVKGGSSAERDGLKRGDVVLKVGGKAIEDLATFKEHLHTLAAGKNDVMLQIHRADTRLNLLLRAPH